MAAALVAVAALRSVLHLSQDEAEPWRRLAALPAQKIDLNQASWLELAWLPGIGEQTAKSIAAQRARLGAPLTLENLAVLPGVGEEARRRIPESWIVRMPTDSVSAQPPPK